LFSTCYASREDASLSALVGQSVQHVHRYAGFLQTIEFGYDMCSLYYDRFKKFLSLGIIDEVFVTRIKGIFNETFHVQAGVDKQNRIFLISDRVVLRAIRLVSGLLEQMKVLMDDTNALSSNGSPTKSMVMLPVNNDPNMNVKKGGRKKTNKLGIYIDYMSISIFFICLAANFHNKKFERIAVEILLFPSLCFTITQLHSNSFLHHLPPIDVRSVLEHLIKCELLECIHKGVKTSRLFTSVYIKRLPSCQPDGKVDNEQR